MAMTQKRRAGGRAATVGKGASEEPAQSDLTRRNIIEVATKEFARKGYSGARVDEIAELTSTSKRMIYYYFENKEGLYVAVLENAYRGIREFEATLNLEHLEPEDAIRTLVGFTFDYQWSHDEFIRLVMVENIHHGVHLAASKTLRNLNVSVLETMSRVYDRGVRKGVFRPGLDQIDIHMTISALSFFNVSNRFTFSKIFNRDIADPKVRSRRRSIVIDTVLRYMLAELPTR